MPGPHHARWFVTRLPRITVIATVVLSCVGCDQWTKRIAASRLDGMPSLSYLAGIVRLSYVENPGAMLGLGTNLPDGMRAWLLVAIGVLTSVALGAFALRAPRLARVEVVAIALLIGGAAGNLIDRVGIGAVRDS
jgi:signal peptidase II